MADFAEAATEQLEILSARTEALLFLSRPPKPPNGPADVALTLRHLATLLIPAAKSDGGTLSVEGVDTPAPTSAPTLATRLALAAGLLSLIKEGQEAGAGARSRAGQAGSGGRCRLESGSETVVRFSHESAAPCSLDPAVAKALAEHDIHNKRSGSDLLLIFPGLT